jgi:hypothetical protein
MMATDPVHIDDWLRIDYPADPLVPVDIAVCETEPTENDFRPAFHENGQAMIRVPDLPSGWYAVWTRVGKRVARRSNVFVSS